MKDKIREVQAVSKMNEKNFKKQQEYLTNLNNQYQLVCDQLGVPTTFTFSKPEELNEFFLKKEKNLQKNDDDIIKELKVKEKFKTCLIFEKRKTKKVLL